MRTGLFIAFAICLAATFFSTKPAEAISRYNSLALTCERAKQLIFAEGAVIIRYPSKRNPALILHDRFVRNASRCQLDEFAARRSIPTSDTNSCRLRYCKIKEVGVGRVRVGIGRD